MLLPLDAIGLDGVGAWLDSVDRLGPLPSVVARAVSPQNDTIETQLLELARPGTAAAILLAVRHAERGGPHVLPLLRRDAARRRHRATGRAAS